MYWGWALGPTDQQGPFAFPSSRCPPFPVSLRPLPLPAPVPCLSAPALQCGDT